MTAAGGRNPGCRVQLFARTGIEPVRWRLLSSNNREIGRGVEFHRDAESCRLAVKELQVNLADVEVAVRRVDGEGWVWRVLLGGRPVAMSSHGYDRQIRCGRGLRQFREELELAEITGEIMTSHSRRWGGSAA